MNKIYIYFTFFVISIFIDLIFNNLYFFLNIESITNSSKNFIQVINRLLLPIWFNLFLLEIYSGKEKIKSDKILKVANWHLLAIVLYYIINRYIIELYTINIYGIHEIFEITIIGYFFYLYFFRVSKYLKKNWYSDVFVVFLLIIIVINFFFTDIPICLKYDSNHNFSATCFLMLALLFAYLFSSFRKLK